MRRAGRCRSRASRAASFDICNAQAVQAAIDQNEARVVINAAAYTGC